MTLEQLQACTPVGSRWRHVNSGSLYEVKGHCVWEMTGEACVLYQCVAPESLVLWSRSGEVFVGGRFRRDWDVMEAVTDKADMYRRLAAGEFGNTLPQWFSSIEWFMAHADESGTRLRPNTLAMWGVRTMSPGGPCRLNCPRDEVMTTAFELLPQGPPPANLSDGGHLLDSHALGRRLGFAPGPAGLRHRAPRHGQWHDLAELDAH